MSQPTQAPDWEARLPGEQWLLLDSVAVAEAVLATYSAEGITIHREPFPNPSGLYARIRFADRIPQNRIYISEPEESE